MSRSLMALLILISLLVAAIVFYLLLKFYQRKMAQGPTATLSTAGVVYQIPVLATFFSPTKFPLLSLGSNSFNPRLELTERGVRYRVFRLRERPWSEIASIDIFRLPRLMTERISIKFKNSSVQVDANVGNVANLKAALRLFEERGAPLTERARNLIGPGTGSN